MSFGYYHNINKDITKHDYTSFKIFNKEIG